MFGFAERGTPGTSAAANAGIAPDAKRRNAAERGLQRNSCRRNAPYCRVAREVNGNAERAGTPRRDTSPEFGNWNSMHKRFCRRRDKGIWKTSADAAIGEPAGDIFMVDSTYIKAHVEHTAAVGISDAQKRRLNSKLHLAVDEYGILASGIVTSGTAADCSQAPLLMEGLEAEAFLADKAYDTNELLDTL